MAEETTYIKCSEELRRLLADNSIDLPRAIQQELQKSGVTVDARWGALPVLGEEPKRDVVLLILAAGLTTTMLATAISRIIDAVTRGKSATATETHVKPALDSTGKPIRDRNGNPVYEKTEKPAAQVPSQETSMTKVSFAKVLEFELSSGVPKHETK